VVVGYFLNRRQNIQQLPTTTIQQLQMHLTAEWPGSLTLSPDIKNENDDNFQKTMPIITTHKQLNCKEKEGIREVFARFLPQPCFA